MNDKNLHPTKLMKENLISLKYKICDRTLHSITIFQCILGEISFSQIFSFLNLPTYGIQYVELVHELIGLIYTNLLISLLFSYQLHDDSTISHYLIRHLYSPYIKFEKNIQNCQLSQKLKFKT